MKRLSRGAGLGLLEIAVPLAILAVWWLMTAGSTSPYWPPLGDVFKAFREEWLFSEVPSELLPTVVRLLVGFLLAGLLGVAGGVVLGLFKPLRSAFMPLLDVFRAIPIAAVIPPAVLVLGTGSATIPALIVFASVWPVLLNTTDGIRGVDPELHEMARVYQLSRRDRILRIDIPAASPQIFAGLRVALALALLTTVLAEMFASASGLGYVISLAQTRFEVADMWAAVFVIMILAYVVNLVFVRLERTALRWHRGSRSALLGAEDG